jgi:hypothetical protein
LIHEFVFYQNGDNAAMTLTKNGNVLIGTAEDDKSNRLQVNGGIGTSGEVFLNHNRSIRMKGSNGTNYNVLFTSGTDLRIGYDSPVINIGNKKMFIDSSGYVGIGTENPAYKLDVAGTGRFTGKTTHDGGIDIPNGQQLAFLDASGNRHTIAWDSASNGILIDGNLIVLGELATGLPMQEIPSIPEIGV